MWVGELATVRGWWGDGYKERTRYHQFFPDQTHNGSHLQNQSHVQDTDGCTRIFKILEFYPWDLTPYRPWTPDTAGRQSGLLLHTCLMGEQSLRDKYLRYQAFKEIPARPQRLTGGHCRAPLPGTQPQHHSPQTRRTCRAWCPRGSPSRWLGVTLPERASCASKKVLSPPFTHARLPSLFLLACLFRWVTAILSCSKLK